VTPPRRRRPDGRREDQLSPEDRAERGAWIGCIAGALSRPEYEAGLTAARFERVSVVFTLQVGDGLHSAIVKATKPAAARRAPLPMASGSSCC